MDSRCYKEAGGSSSCGPSCPCDDEGGNDQKDLASSTGSEGRCHGSSGAASPYFGQTPQEVSEAVRACQESWYNRWKHTYRD